MGQLEVGRDEGLTVSVWPGRRALTACGGLERVALGQWPFCSSPIVLSSSHPRALARAVPAAWNTSLRVHLTPSFSHDGCSSVPPLHRPQKRVPGPRGLSPRQHRPPFQLHLRDRSLVASSKSVWPHKVTYLQVLEIRTWTSLGSLFSCLSTTPNTATSSKPAAVRESQEGVAPATESSVTS